MSHMQVSVTLYSKIFLETDDDSWSARPSPSLIQRLHQSEGSARWITCISDTYISLGDPIHSVGNNNVLYLPQWFMESIGVDDGDVMNLDFKRSEEMPRATSLSFRMLGSGAPDVDIRDLLEEPLSQLGVLQVGQIIPVPALEGTMLLLESCEPDGVVFLDGAEIALDIVGDSPPPSPLNSAPFDDMPMIPSCVPVSPPLISHERSKSRFPPKFIPFQGVGNRLG